MCRFRKPTRKHSGESRRIAQILRKLSGIAIVSVAILAFPSHHSAYAAEIVHDAEFYILRAQYGDKWSVQDAELDAKLKSLRDKYGKPPNIIHIMWDDTAVGEIGIPEIQKVRGWETPHLNQLAAEGINFMRMYTEPSCTPSRAAVMTGRPPEASV